MEVSEEVRVIMISQKCDQCKTGNMKCTGTGFTQMNTSWEHKCDLFKKIKWYDVKYPLITYRHIDEKGTILQGTNSK